MAVGGYFDDSVSVKEEADPDDAEDFDFDAPDIPLASGRGASETMELYFSDLERRMRLEYQLAEACRAKGFDPQTFVEIPPAIDLAARVEELMKDYLPQRGVAERIRELSKIKNREETSLLVANEVAAGKFGVYEDKTKALDGAIRTGLAILTEGILVAPLEGIAGVRILQNDDGTDCVSVSFAGPIRAAGGTGQALSVLIADVVRRALGIGKYIATEKEISRMKEEIPAYKQAANLQYVPSNEEIELIMRSCPIMIDGEGTEKDEIGGNRDLPRIETNQIRGGACLVLAEGMTQKAPKIQKNVKALKLDGWEFIDQVIEYVKKKGANAAGGEGGKKFTDPWAKDAEEPRGTIEPSPKYLADLIAGRPVFAYPSRKGGWRLRYGRARTGGLATTAIHPAAMALVDDFLAPGTQMKVERPGKATAVTPCDSIDGPIALLANGNLIEVKTYRHAKAIRPLLRQVADLGEILVPYGEFAENNKTLPQSPWCDEWWAMTAEKATGAPAPQLITAEDAFEFAATSGTPLSPRYNLFWHDLKIEQLVQLATFVEAHGIWEPIAKTATPDISAHPEAYTLALPRQLAEEEGIKDIFIELGALHECDTATIRLGRHAYAVVRACGLDVKNGAIARVRPLEALPEGATKAAAQLSGVQIRPRAMFRIGTRMGRPEKAAERKMSPPVHLLFPIGIAGGSQRLMADAVKVNKIEIEVGERRCPKCQQSTVQYRCETCSEHTSPVPPKGRMEARTLELAPLWNAALKRLNMDAPTTVKGVQGLVSAGKFPEPMEKGILRAKHGMFTFKDATVRYDMINVTLTHFKPREAHVSVEKLKELGYTVDIKGEPITRDDQTIELRVQDIIVATGCLDYMLKASQYVDELLMKLYSFKPFYNCKTREDLFGHLFVALAPHTSGGVLCRIIGHTKAQAHYGHPYFHAAKRRNCVPYDTELWVVSQGVAKKVKIGELVEEAFRATGARPRALDTLGTASVDLPSPLEAITLDPATQVPRLVRISTAIRGRTEAWVRITTATGRVFVCTPDHNVLTREAGTWIAKPAAKAAAGDMVPVGLAMPPGIRGVTLDGKAPAVREGAWHGLDIVTSVDRIEETAQTYCVDIESGSTDLTTKNLLWGNGLYQIRCDGDEDCVMLLLDGLLNFSRSYLPSTRGGLMDAPLTLTMRLDPSEVDKEAHNVDVGFSYSLEFYEATLKHPGPKDVEKMVDMVSRRLGTPAQYEGFGFTHDTADIAEGPPLSAYKTIGSMMDKMTAQLELAHRIRAVDAPDVASRVIGSHFLPDMMGNLKAFSKQSMRCTKCSAKFRRVPLTGKCRKCGNPNLTMTVHEGSVKKYLEVSREVSVRFELDDYTKQRIEHVADSIDSTFTNDRVKKAKLSDFF